MTAAFVICQLSGCNYRTVYRVEYKVGSSCKAIHCLLTSQLSSTNKHWSSWKQRNKDNYRYSGHSVLVHYPHFQTAHCSWYGCHTHKLSFIGQKQFGNIIIFSQYLCKFWTIVSLFVFFPLIFNFGFRKGRLSQTLWEKEKLLITSTFSFSHSVFKRLVLLTRKNQGLSGKGLIKSTLVSSVAQIVTCKAGSWG